MKVDVELMSGSKFGRDALEFKCFQLSWTKIKYMQWKFSKSKNRDKGVVRVDGQ